MGRMISFHHSGNFSKTEGLLSRLVGGHYYRKLKKYAQKGVEALAEATPKDTGGTADAWSYEIEERPGQTAIYWSNSHVEKGVNIAVILQFGHGTRNGGFVEGIDYINPAMRPVFEEIAQQVWREIVE